MAAGVITPGVRRGLLAISIVAATVWVYAPVRHGGWVWDDELEITHNADLRASAWWTAWVQPAGADYLPLKTLFQRLEWSTWGEWPEGYHAASLALHLACAFLLWRLLAKLGLRLAWLGALLFAVHPLAVESVAWIAEQKNLLSLGLLLAAAAAWADFDAKRRARAYALALILFGAALLCKASVVMLPVMLLLYALWKRRRLAWRDAADIAPFFALALAAGIMTVIFQHERAIGGASVPLGGLTTQLGRAGAIVGFYFWKTLWPVGLLPVYPAAMFEGTRVMGALVWFAWLALAVGCWVRRATWGAAVWFGAGCFLANLVPVLGFVPMAYHRIAWVADHFAYVSLAVAAGLAAAGVQRATEATTAVGRAAVAGGLMVAVLLAAGETRSHAANFRSEEALWTYTLARNPAAWIGWNNLGRVDAQAGRAVEAAVKFARVVELQPDFADGHYNLANALASLGRWPEAIASYERAIALKPGGPEIHNNLGNAMLQSGDVTAALAHYTESVRLAPDFADAHANRARALKRAGRRPEALAEWQTARRLAPDSGPITGELGNALADAGLAEEALAALQAAARLQPDAAEAHNNLGALLAERGSLAEARREFEAAVRLKPDFGAAQENLATLRRQTAEQAPAARHEN